MDLPNRAPPSVASRVLVGGPRFSWIDVARDRRAMKRLAPHRRLPPKRVRALDTEESRLAPSARIELAAPGLGNRSRRRA